MYILIISIIYKRDWSIKPKYFMHIAYHNNVMYIFDIRYTKYLINSKILYTIDLYINIFFIFILGR